MLLHHHRRHRVRVHLRQPLLGADIGEIGQPHGLPVLTGERPPASLAVGSLEPSQPGNRRMLPRPAPWRVQPTVPSLPQHNDMQGHCSTGRGHIPSDIPSMHLTRCRVRVPAIHNRPAMQHPLRIGEC